MHVAISIPVLCIVIVYLIDQHIVSFENKWFPEWHVRCHPINWTFIIYSLRSAVNVPKNVLFLLILIGKSIMSNDNKMDKIWNSVKEKKRRALIISVSTRRNRNTNLRACIGKRVVKFATRIFYPSVSAESHWNFVSKFAEAHDFSRVSLFLSLDSLASFLFIAAD